LSSGRAKSEATNSTQKENIMENKNEIKIWQYEDSPEDFRFVYDDVDWIVFVPDTMYDVWKMIFVDKGYEINSYRVTGGMVHIQSH
jgi:hypothetical protein